MIKARVLTALLLLCATTAFGEDVRAHIKNTFPKLTVDAVQESGVAGLYEITSGANILYYALATDNFILGDILSKEGVNLTAARRQTVAAKKYDNLDLSKAVKIGNGPTKVVLFTDPDCPFCRKVDGFLSKLPNITLYVFFSPIASLHPSTETKVACILGSNDPGDTYRKTIAGEFDKKPLKVEPAGIAKMQGQKALAASLGIKGTPVLYINGTLINGADFAAIDHAITTKVIASK